MIKHFIEELINWMYFIVLFSCVACGAILFIGDLWRGLGVACAYTLFIIIQDRKRHEDSMKIQKAMEKIKGEIINE